MLVPLLFLWFLQLGKLVVPGRQSTFHQVSSGLTVGDVTESHVDCFCHRNGSIVLLALLPLPANTLLGIGVGRDPVELLLLLGTQGLASLEEALGSKWFDVRAT